MQVPFGISLVTSDQPAGFNVGLPRLATPAQVLRYLVEFELKESENPRRLLRRGTCAFSILFRLFSEGLYAAKLFLTATLHEPIMQLLVEDEDHLETDAAKLTERFTPAQQERLFGEKGSEGYRRRVQAAVEANEAKLVALVNKFIGYLKQNTYCFPHSLRWIVSQMYKTLSRVERLEMSEVRTMCTDLLLTCFICPAIVNPEQYGIISDAPINEVARFNLMQVRAPGRGLGRAPGCMLVCDEVGVTIPLYKTPLR